MFQRPNSDIIQLLTADGWEAYYTYGHIEDVVDVVCFALHRNGEISPMIWLDGKIVYAGSKKQFSRIVKQESRDYL